MPAGKLDIEIESGATFKRTLTLTDNSNAVMNLSNVSAVRGQIRPYPESSSVSGSFTLTVTDAVNGKIEWTMAAATTANLQPIQQSYDIEVEYNDGTVVRLLEGKVSIDANVTR